MTAARRPYWYVVGIVGRRTKPSNGRGWSKETSFRSIDRALRCAAKMISAEIAHELLEYPNDRISSLVDVKVRVVEVHEAEIEAEGCEAWEYDGRIVGEFHVGPLG